MLLFGQGETGPEGSHYQKTACIFRGRIGSLTLLAQKPPGGGPSACL